MSLAARIHSDGGEGPTLVYIPGIDGTGEYLLGTADRLREHFRLIMIEYFDDDSPLPDSYEHHAATLHEALTEHNLHPDLLLAESFGGAVALQYCLDHPGEIQGLALVNTFPWYRRRTKLRLTRLLFPLTRTRLFYALRRRLAPWALFGQLREPEALRLFQARTDPIFDSLYARRLALIAHLDLRPRLEEIDCPVLLFASEKDRVVDSVRQARLMHSLLPHSRLHIIPLGGHLILPLASIPWPQHLQSLLPTAR